MKIVLRRFKLLNKSLWFLILSLLQSLLYRYRLVFKYTSIWSLLLTLIKLIIAFNVVFSFPVPFLFEPLNGLVALFKSIFDDIIELIFRIYLWIKEKLSILYGTSNVPDVPEMPDRQNRGRSPSSPRWEPHQEELTEEEEEYLQREWYKNTGYTKESSRWSDPIVILGFIIIMGCVVYYGYHYYTSHSGGGAGRRVHRRTHKIYY